ncbi:hypothetical protein DRO54_07255 [Candidatus Bathyarchaeota archaeon]|nr:MAG: hypothetical protein DRO54_07255 [Candidatus Bathyarchaeota archaeon]
MVGPKSVNVPLNYLKLVKALKKKFIGTWISSALFKKVEDYCRLNGYTKSELLRQLLRGLVGENLPNPSIQEGEN